MNNDSESISSLLGISNERTVQLAKNCIAGLKAGKHTNKADFVRSVITHSKAKNKTELAYCAFMTALMLAEAQHETQELLQHALHSTQATAIRAD